jgi:hypothetical protein
MADYEPAKAALPLPNPAALTQQRENRFGYQRDWMSVKETDDFGTHSHGAAR